MTDSREVIEASIRRLMARVASMPNRGYDSNRARQPLLAEIDRLFDAYAMPELSIDGHVGDPNALTCSTCNGRPRDIVARQALVCSYCDGPSISGTPSISETHITKGLE